MWKITDSKRCDTETTIEELKQEYPNLVAYDESGWDVDIDDFIDDPEGLADAGYVDRDQRRILFWATEEESENDPGHRTVACAEWEV